jgi:methylglutaconyl-CoA hydratase
MEAYITHFEKEGIGYLEFGNPAGNSLPSKLLYDLEARLEILANSETVKVIVIQSAGQRAFCGGASLSDMKALKNLKEATHFFMGFAKLLNRIRLLDKFVIGRVQGKVVGGGVGLVAACDYAIALETASVKLSELSIGIGPYVIEPAVSRKIGTTAFSQLSLEAHQWKSAQWAAQKGLFAEVCTTLEALDQNVNAMATRLARYPQKANLNLRKLHWKDTEHWENTLPHNAEITAKLALEQATQDILKKL